jgi:hypothetical protein
MPLTRSLLLSVVVALVSAGPQLQRPSDEAQKAVGEAFKLQADGKYLAAISRLERIDTNANEADKSYVGQLLATLYSYVGEQEKTERIFHDADPGLATKAGDQTPALETAAAVDAIEEIVRLARDRQIVILNEAHHVPRHRAFSLLLARELRKIGYEYFAAETFADEIPELWKQGFPSRRAGFYTAEPVFGDLVRQAMALGYTPVAYEARKPAAPDADEADRVNTREIQQAQNLVDRVFEINPKAKLFVHCGYSHATENWAKTKDGRDYAWMAARLGRLTAIDPLTIDQTKDTPTAIAAEDSPEYLAAEKEGPLTRPTVFKKANGGYLVTGDYGDKIDVGVFHPRERRVNGRPDWLAMNGYRKPLEIAPNLLPKERVLLQAFVASEPADAIPIDQLIVDAPASAPVLMLPPGAYRIVVQKADGSDTKIADVVQR